MAARALSTVPAARTPGARRLRRPPRRFFELLGSQTGVWLWSLDPDAGEFEVYSDLTPMLGEHPRSMEAIMSFIHPDDREPLKGAFVDSVENGGSGTVECRLRSAAGTWLRFHITYCTEPHASGRFVLHGLSRDVTALSEAQASAAETIRQTRLAESLSGIGYWRFDLGSQTFTWSEQMYRAYGLDPAAGPPPIASLPNLCHPEDIGALMDHHLLYKGREAPALEFRIIRPDGDIRHVVTRNTIERDAEGNQLARFGTLQDITEIKRAEAVARENEERYRFIAEHAVDMIVRVSPDGHLRFVSPGVRQVFGYSPEEMMTQSAVEMTHPDDMAMVAARVEALMERRCPHLSEPLRYRARHKDGSWVWIESNPSVIFDELTGEPMESIDIIRNISQAKAAEAELEQARRTAEAAVVAKSAFLANMSHELRTPLTSITGFSRLIEDRTDIPTEARHFTRRIRDASEALLSIINDVLDFSKLEAGQVELERQPLSISRLVEETSGLLSIQAAAKEVEIRIELDPWTPPQIHGDVARLRQVLLNLISNAIKFTQHGSVTISTAYRPLAQRLCIAVTDTGAGIAPDAVQRLFERFSQAEVSINRTHGGTGLGLAICKGIVELMGGEIGVQTEVGVGSSFWFEIPAAPAEAAEDYSADERTAADLPPLRLLVVDDTAVNRELVRLMLEPLGLQIEEAGGGAEGVQAAMSRPFDLILMDVRMPGVDGLEATRVIRGASIVNRRTPILALTADVQAENALACRAAGMNDVLSKPIIPQQLISKILEWSSDSSGEAALEGVG